jgi:hypothetical protein
MGLPQNFTSLINVCKLVFDTYKSSILIVWSNPFIGSLPAFTSSIHWTRVQY